MESGLRLLVALCCAVAVPCDALQKSLAHVLWFFTLRWREQRQDMSSTPLSWEGVRVAGRGSYFMRDPNLISGAKAKSRLACHILRPLKTQNPCPDSRCWRLPFFFASWITSKQT